VLEGLTNARNQHPVLWALKRKAAQGENAFLKPEA
jgi:hypothetical protein